MSNATKIDWPLQHPLGKYSIRSIVTGVSVMTLEEYARTESVSGALLKLERTCLSWVELRELARFLGNAYGKPSDRIIESHRHNARLELAQNILRIYESLALDQRITFLKDYFLGPDDFDPDELPLYGILPQENEVTTLSKEESEKALAAATNKIPTLWSKEEMSKQQITQEIPLPRVENGFLLILSKGQLVALKLDEVVCLRKLGKTSGTIIQMGNSIEYAVNCNIETIFSFFKK